MRRRPVELEADTMYDGPDGPVEGPIEMPANVAPMATRLPGCQVRTFIGATEDRTCLKPARCYTRTTASGVGGYYVCDEHAEAFGFGADGD